MKNLMKQYSIARLARIGMVVLFAAVVGSCGGGGGCAGKTNSNPGGCAGTGATASSTGGNVTPGSGALPGDPQLTVSIVDGTGTVIRSLSGGQTGTVRATVIDGSGAAAAFAVVQFTASVSTLVDFTPVSASALSDASGVAVMKINPKDFSSAGALTISASASVGAKTATGSTTIAVGAASLTVGALSFTPAPAPGVPLASSSAVTLNIPVSSNGQPVNTAPGLIVTSNCVGVGRAILSLGSFSGGVMSATYTNLGCDLVTDTITASIGTSTQSISIGVSTSNIGQIQYIGSDLNGASLVLKGSGGVGRKESALLTFRLVDNLGIAIPNQNVTFKVTTATGGLSVQPLIGTTDANGLVVTSVSSGTIPTPVRVIAEATRNGVTVTGLSDGLTVSTGLPIQKAMSFSADHYNIEGLDYDGEVANITVLMADQYGNPVSDNTTINFVAEGGAVGSSLQGACSTSNGGCTVPLKSQNFRPANGRVTVLAYAQGIEDFTDTNGDGQYSCAGWTGPGIYRPLVDVCPGGGEPSTDMGDPFLDAGDPAVIPGVPTPSGTLDGSYDSGNGDLPFPYNSTTYRSTGNGSWGINYIRASAEFIFSGSDAVLIRQVCTAGVCQDWDPAVDGDPSIINGLAGAACSNQLLTFRVADVNNNPMPYGTTVAAADIDKITPQTFFPASVLSTSSVGGTFHRVNIKKTDLCEAGSFSINITTPKGLSTVYFFTGT